MDIQQQEDSNMLANKTATKTASETVIEFKEKYNLTYAELAVALGKSEQTVKSYCFDKSSKNKRTPPPSVLVQIKTVDRFGVQLEHVWCSLLQIETDLKPDRSPMRLHDKSLIRYINQ